MRPRPGPTPTSSWPSSTPGSSYRGRGSVYTVKKFCATPPTFYLAQFPFPDKPLDEDAATKLSEEIDRLQNVVIPALESKSTQVQALLN
jgi:hypothetical protein